MAVWQILIIMLGTLLCCYASFILGKVVVRAAFKHRTRIKVTHVSTTGETYQVAFWADRRKPEDKELLELLDQVRSDAKAKVESSND